MKTSDLERASVEVVANVAPWLAPLPTAWLIYERTMTHLGWPVPVAAIAGLTLELLGVGILATWLMLYTYNRSKRKSDPAAPMWLPGGLVLLYFLTAEALTFALDVWPVAAVAAPALFPVLSVAAFALLALRANHQQRLTDIEHERSEAKAGRERRKQKREQNLNTSEQVPGVRNEASCVAPVTLPFVCVVCGAVFDSQRALSGHGNRHRGGNGNGANEKEHERQYQRP